MLAETSACLIRSKEEPIENIALPIACNTYVTSDRREAVDSITSLVNNPTMSMDYTAMAIEEIIFPTNDTTISIDNMTMSIHNTTLLIV
jgi:hypothetical protein